MDKSLKKLNRLELLELMVVISAERDALVEENERMRRALKAKPSIPRATKVGSIAELALQTNGFFEAAQHAADDYLREIKRMRDQLAARAASEGCKSVAARDAVAKVPQIQASQANEELVRDAQAQARAIVSRAQSQAESMLVEARAKSDSVIADANRQSRAIILRANRQADAVISAAHSDAGRTRHASINPGLSAPIRGRHVRAASEGA